MKWFSFPRTPQHKICPILGYITSKDRVIISVYTIFNLQASPPNALVLHWIRFGPNTIFFLWILWYALHNHILMHTMIKKSVYNEECQGWGFCSLFPFDLDTWETNTSRLRWEWSVNEKHKTPLMALLMVIMADKKKIDCIYVQRMMTISMSMGLKNDISTEWECKRKFYSNTIKIR